MTWLWRHKRSHVKNSENCQKSSKSRVSAEYLCDQNDVVVIGLRVHLGMIFIKINSIKYTLCSLKHEKTNFVAFPMKSTDWISMTPPYLRLLTGHHDPVEGGTSAFLTPYNDCKGWTYIIEAFCKIVCRFSATRGVIVTPPVRSGLKICWLIKTVQFGWILMICMNMIIHTIMTTTMHIAEYQSW